MKKRKQGKTAKMDHGNAHMGEHGGKDPHASAEHHKHNAAHGMVEGHAPSGPEYDDDGDENYCG